MLINTPLDFMKHKIQRAPILLDPYPHFFVENVFPDDFYKMLLKYLPKDREMKPIGTTGKVSKGAYLERHIFDFSLANFDKLSNQDYFFWRSFWNYLKGHDFIKMQMEKFAPYLKERFSDNFKHKHFYPYAELVKDRQNYSIGPHTDHPERAITMLFYLPNDASMLHLGTSIYKPKIEGFRCRFGKHHQFEDFVKIKTLPFLPNSVFGFVRSDESFHGLELIQDADIHRNLLNYILKIRF